MSQEIQTTNEQMIDNAPASKQHESMATVDSTVHNDNYKAEPTWKYSDSIPGEGEKPDWLMDGFTVESQAKLGKSLRQSVAEKQGPPEEYKLDLGEEYKDWQLDNEDPLTKAWNDYAKNNKLSNEAYNAGVKMWFDYMKGFGEQHAAKQEAAIKELGLDGKQTLTELQTWFDNNFGDDYSFDSFKNMMQTPQDVRLLMKMRDLTNGSSLVSRQESQQPKDREYFKSLMTREKGYGVNQKYTQQVLADFEKFVAAGGSID